MSGINQWGHHNEGIQVGYAASGTILTSNVHNYHAGQYYPQAMSWNLVDQSSAPAERPKPQPSNNTPFTRDEDFVARGDVLGRIGKHLETPGSRVALVGLGGVG